MATDAEILTAARNLSSAVVALKDAEAVVTRLGNELQRAGQAVDEKRKHAKECEQRLMQLASRKPSEPPPKAEKELVAAQTPSGGGKLPPPEEKPPEVKPEAPEPAKVLTHGITPTSNLTRRR